MKIQTRYVIISINDVIDNMIEEAINTASSYRRNTGGTKAILKFRTQHPNTMAGKVKFNHDQIITELEAEEWVSVV